MIFARCYLYGNNNFSGLAVIAMIDYYYNDNSCHEKNISLAAKIKKLKGDEQNDRTMYFFCCCWYNFACNIKSNNQQ